MQVYDPLPEAVVPVTVNVPEKLHVVPFAVTAPNVTCPFVVTVPDPGAGLVTVTIPLFTVAITTPTRRPNTSPHMFH